MLLATYPSKQIKNSSHIHSFVLQHHNVPGPKYAIVCLLCRKGFSKIYYCETCRFHLCPTCVNQNPLSADPGKTHEHPLIFFFKPSFIFTCDACGVGDVRSSMCMCIPCCFAIHFSCVRLPRVICINRHEHRISLHLPLGSGNWSCRVCRKHVNGEYGGYSCLTCSNYGVHSKCATHYLVWDHIELDGVPEEDPEEIMPFKVVDEGVIKHFCHEHNLRLTVLEEGEDVHLRNKQCSACILPIYSDPSYICIHHCDFILHEVCANFLKKRRHPAHSRRFTLSFSRDDSHLGRDGDCRCCNQPIINNGFLYEDGNYRIDALCASFQDGYVHASHPHSELVFLDNYKVCSNCRRDRRDPYVKMGCTECEDFKVSVVLLFPRWWSTSMTSILFLYATVTIRLVNIGVIYVRHV